MPQHHAITMAVITQTSSFTVMQYTTVAAAGFVMGGIMRELLLVLVAEAAAVPLIPELIGCESVVFPSPA
jgi:hypothetical protein